MNFDYGKSFREARKQMGFTQKEVATRLGIHQSNVSDWENNVSRPEYEKLVELARMYDVSLDDLLGVQRKENFFSNRK